jgi:hypothetical protein
VTADIAFSLGIVAAVGAVVVYVVRPTILKPAPAEKASTWLDLSRGVVRF